MPLPATPDHAPCARELRAHDQASERAIRQLELKAAAAAEAAEAQLREAQAALAALRVEHEELCAVVRRANATEAHLVNRLRAALRTGRPADEGPVYGWLEWSEYRTALERRPREATLEDVLYGICARKHEGRPWPRRVRYRPA